MSPEQLQGFRATVRSDVYAVGLMLYEALYGTHPCLLSNPSPTVRELALIQRVKQPPLLSELDPGIPRHVARAVARAMEKVPEKRVQSMAELRAALATCLERLATDAPAAVPAPATKSTFVERHDTEPLSPHELFGPTPKLEAADVPPAPELTSWDHRTHTAPPVITDSHSDLGGDERRRALRRVVGAGAVVGTVCGVALYFVLPKPHRAAAFGAESPHVAVASVTAPAVARTSDAATNVTASASAPPVTLAPSASVVARAPATPSAAGAPATSASPRVAAPVHRATPKKHSAPTAPEHEVWIE